MRNTLHVSISILGLATLAAVAIVPVTVLAQSGPSNLVSTVATPPKPAPAPAAKPATTGPATQTAVPAPAAKLVAPPAPAAAQVAAPTAAALSTTDLPLWVKTCSTDTATNKDSCMVVQRVIANTGQHIATASVRDAVGDPKQRQLLISVPLGVVLASGLTAQVDTGKALTMKYAVCFIDGCYAQANIDDAFLKSLRGGSKLTVTVTDTEGKQLTLPLTLAGFSKIYDGKGVDAATATAQFNQLATAAKAKGDAGTAKPQ